MISNIMDVEIEFVTDDQQIRPDKSEVERLCADNSIRLHSTMGYKTPFVYEKELCRKAA